MTKEPLNPVQLTGVLLALLSIVGSSLVIPLVVLPYGWGFVTFGASAVSLVCAGLAGMLGARRLALVAAAWALLAPAGYCAFMGFMGASGETDADGNHKAELSGCPTTPTSDREGD